MKYGTMVARLLYIVKFCRTLQKLSYKLNPYEPCVYNRDVDGKQQTICFHVDACRASPVYA